MSVLISSHLKNTFSSEEMRHTWGILGGGFGLYGYLPAIAGLKNTKVVVLEKHLPFLESRSELKRYAPIIRLVKSRDDILSQADSLIFSVPPRIQEELLRQIDPLQRYKFLVLEKPLAATPEAAVAMLKKGIEIASFVRVGYSFLYSTWGETIRQSDLLLSAGDCKVSWKFFAHHFRSQIISWKGDHEQGGGALRFYGIHLIAYFESINQTVVEYSRLICDQYGAPARWQARFKIHNGARITVDLDSRSQIELFEIHTPNDVCNFKILNPFSGESSENDEDSRVPVLKRFLEISGSSNDEIYKFYYRVNQLWAEVEKITEWVSIDE
jgi:predicted dehydrogenase